MPKILDVKIDDLSWQACLGRIEEWLEQEQPRHIVTPNPEFIVRASQDPDFKNILNQADLSVCDGTGLLLAAKFLREPIQKRIPGADLFEGICDLAWRKNRAVYLLGGREGAVAKTAAVLDKKYPGLKIAYHEDENKTPFIDKPSILFVALGAPKQEKWIHSNLLKMPQVKLAMGVGGTFDFVSGRIQRAPKFLRKAGLEWFWRLLREPKRIGRIYRAIILFPYLIIKSKLRQSRS